MRLIDADALIADCQLAQKQADRHGREFANAFYSGGGEVSTEWWCVEDMIENAPTIEARKRGRWERVNISYLSDMDEEAMEAIAIASMFCPRCKRYHNEVYLYGNPTEGVKYCPNCGADMREEGGQEWDSTGC